MADERFELKQRRNRRTGLIGLVLVILIAGIAWLALRSDSDPSTVDAGQRQTTTRQSSTTSAPDRTAGTAGAAGSTALSAAPTSTPPVRPAKSGPEITIAFAGDNNGEGLPEGDMAAAMAQRLSPMKGLLSGADLTVANLETAITSRGQGATKAFTFRAPPPILSGMQSAGIDVVSMANNHGLDFGPDGLQDSLAAKHAAPIPIVGIGANDKEAFAPATFNVKGLHIAVIGATQVLDSSLITAWTATANHGGLASAKRVDRLVAEVKKAKTSNDIVIVFLHWGTEKMTCPNPAQKELAQTLASAGATLIIGGHAHRVQSGGFLGTSFVDFGLGNFGFHASSPDAAHTGVLTVTMKGSAVKGYEWHPGLISNSVPSPLAGAAAQQAIDTWNQLRTCTGLSASAPGG